uniref:Uncharacterized protein n=1 Tax=Knipowitschia caucasica TaxID=637954 RepID=A0AAV2KTZ4_KNICA
MKLLPISHFLWPRWGLEHSREILELLQSEQFVTRPLLVHAFSIGAYTFAQLLVHVSRDAPQFDSLTQRIRGQVYDSVVAGSVEHMATGLGKTMFPQFESLIRRASLTYFDLFKRQTLDYFNTGIDVFWNTPVKAPALFFYCKNDAMSNWETVDQIIDHWAKSGIHVTGKKWEESTHAGHLKRHTQEYLSAIHEFLHSRNFPVRRSPENKSPQLTPSSWGMLKCSPEILHSPHNIHVRNHPSERGI